MRVLAIDTSSDTATVAVMEDDILLGEYIINHKKTHSQKIMVMIERLLEDLELSVSDIDVFSAAVGPGSFTGLRIGVATIKALAHSVKKPTVGVSTLEGLAYNIPFTDALIVTIMDARRNHVFNGAYEWENGVLKEVIEPNACDIKMCIDRVRDKKTVFVGDGVNVHRSIIKDTLCGNVSFAPGHLRNAKASSVAMCAMDKLNKGIIVNYADLKPEYLRLSQAERELLDKKKQRGE